MPFFLRTVVFALVCSVSVLSAQEGLPVYHDYLSDNWYLIHPAMAGAGQGGKVRLTARKQWFDVDRAPNLQTLNAHMRLGRRSGVGAIVFNDENGYHSQSGLKLSYAHHLQFSRDMVDLHQLSFGLSAGYMQSRLDESEFQSVIPDPIIGVGAVQSSYFNVDVGASYHFLDFYAHITIRNLVGSGRDLYTVEEFDNLRRYLFSAGYVFGGGDWKYEPSFLVQYGEFTRETMGDLNFKVYRDFPEFSLWGGLSYRRSLDAAIPASAVQGQDRYNGLDLITPIAGVNYKNFMLAYTYSYQFGNAIFDNGGFHQITLGYDFMNGDKPYSCNCPAVNY